MKKDFSKRIFVGITGFKDCHWKDKLKEIEKFKLDEVTLFLERFEEKQRKEIYKALLVSDIKKIPLVHIRNDMKREELVFLVKNFDSKYLTIHEDSFKYMEKWRRFFKDLYLEMNTDSFVSESVDVSRIGGFCIDLAHFKVEQAEWSEEFEYIFKRRKISHYFDCNHLNGYDPKKNIDLHRVSGFGDFNFLKTLPEFVFGKVIALELDNSIKEQLKYKKYLVKLLNNLFIKK